MHNKTVAHLGRLKDIVFILLKFGFDDIVKRLDLPGIKFLHQKHLVDLSVSKWERIRVMLQELGPGFIKIGQILSMRPDILPAPLLFELRKLQDDVTAESFETIETIVEQELDRPLDTVFSFFEKRPLAAASLSQVHRAVLRENNKVVAVKVQRPDIEKNIAIDLHILALIASKADERIESFQYYNLPGVVAEIEKVLTRELEFSREARHMLIARNNFSKEKMAHIPEVFSRYSTDRMLIMELVQGARIINNTSTLENRRELAQTGLRLMIQQIFADGFYHADPHPGNVLILDNSKYCLLDWGMVGRLTATTRVTILALVQAAIDKDSESALEALLALVTRGKTPGFDERKLERDIIDILDTYHSLALEDVKLGSLLLDLSALVRQHKLSLPAELSLVIKALITAEGTARQLYPSLNIVREAEPYIKKIVMDQWQPLAVTKRLKVKIHKMIRLSSQMPELIKKIMTELSHGRLSIHFVHENLEELTNSLENITNRLTFGIIIAALIIGSSMIITTGVKPLLFGYPALGVIGYLVSGILGLWLVFNMIRSSKL